MTSSTANPRRTTLSALVKGELATCGGHDGACRNIAVRVVQEDGKRRLLCRSCS